MEGPGGVGAKSFFQGRDSPRSFRAGAPGPAGTQMPNSMPGVFCCCFRQGMTAEVSNLGQDVSGFE